LSPSVLASIEALLNPKETGQPDFRVGCVQLRAEVCPPVVSRHARNGRPFRWRYVSMLRMGRSPKTDSTENQPQSNTQTQPVQTPQPAAAQTLAPPERIAPTAPRAVTES